jgi:hypothetical protein
MTYQFNEIRGNMKTTKKIEITITINTIKANINADKWGETYDCNGYPN